MARRGSKKVSCPEEPTDSAQRGEGADTDGPRFLVDCRAVVIPRLSGPASCTWGGRPHRTAAGSLTFSGCRGQGGLESRALNQGWQGWTKHPTTLLPQFCSPQSKSLC